MNTSKLAHQARLKTWAESFQNQKESGLTVMEWCSQNGVSKNAFFYWKRRLRDELVESRLPEIVRLPLTTETGALEAPASNCTSCTSGTTGYLNHQEPGTGDADNAGRTSCTSGTTDTTPAAIPEQSIPKLPEPHHPDGSLIIHIQDISMEINEDTPDSLVTRMIKAVRDA